MFGSRIVNRVIYQALSADERLDGITINRGLVHPQGTQLPAILFYREQSQYHGAVINEQAEHINAETLRYVVRVDGKGLSDSGIAPLAMAQLEVLAGLIVDTEDGHQVTFATLGEVAIDSSYQDGTPYQVMGNVYQVTVTKG